MAIVLHAVILVIRIWTVNPMEEELLEDLMTNLGVGHVIIMAILLLNFIQRGATHVVALVTRLKNSQVKGVNLEGAHHIHQQGELMNHGRSITKERLKIRRQAI